MTSIPMSVRGSDMYRRLTSYPHDLQHNLSLNIQQDPVVCLLDTISLATGCESNIEEFISPLGDAIPLVPLGIGHTCKHSTLYQVLMHIDIEKNQSWSGIPSSRSLCRFHHDLVVHW